jgi:hypothetical protein
VGNTFHLWRRQIAYILILGAEVPVIRYHVRDRKANRMMFNDAYDASYLTALNNRYKGIYGHDLNVFLARAHVAIAQTCKGRVYIAYLSQGKYPYGIFQTPKHPQDIVPNWWLEHELPTLQRNKDVTEIWGIDMSTEPPTEKVEWKQGDPILPACTVDKLRAGCETLFETQNPEKVATL